MKHLMSNIKILTTFVVLSTIFLPLTSSAELMSSENYSVEAGRVGSGIISIPNATSTNYQADVSFGQQSEYTPSTYACNDGVDNDSDGLIDYPNDSGCSSASDNDETNIVAVSGGGGSGEGGFFTPSHINSFDAPLSISSDQSGTLTQTMSAEKSVKLEIPSNSVSSETTFTISEEILLITDAPKPAVKAELTGDNVFRVIAKDSAGKLVHTFLQELTITITIPTLPDDTTNVGLYYFDTAQQLWVLIPDAVFGDEIVTFQVDHLTDFAIFYVPGLPPTLPILFLIGDTNDDNKVDILDFNTLMVHWGETGISNIADFSGDSVVDIFDFNILMVHWTS